ncbi:MAG: phosphoribosylamine--glycine ligase [Tannerellaceae bacterium]|jgi:phosphoribosylamine--glycine ligase|nr:phosphoribosylamine--glycine ligase [Tannerellaceae bacterium]
MNILLLGSGAREHAMAWKINESKHAARIFIAPGNAGTASLCTNLPINLTDFDALKQACIAHDIQMVIPGPEEPLVRGVYDYFINDPALRHIPVIGPSAAGAELEGSKDFAKAFMMRHGIPTAAYRTFRSDTIADAFAFLQTLQPPYVLKADGLAAGKGVIIVDSLDDAQRELRDMLNGRFGKASNKVVIEEYLRGIECSVFILTDGANFVTLPVAKDYKRVGEGDTGANTGGMGAVSPVPFADKEFMRKTHERILLPTVRGLRAEGIPYKGFIFVGLMNVGGEPYVVEYNCRMGDPETQVVFSRIQNDIVDLFNAVASETLNEQAIVEDERAAVTVVLASGGYPARYEANLNIEGLDCIFPDNTIIFHAATRLSNSQILTSGGRVLSVSARGDSISEALELAYQAAERIRFKDMYYRRDIGFDL